MAASFLPFKSADTMDYTFASAVEQFVYTDKIDLNLQW